MIVRPLEGEVRELHPEIVHMASASVRFDASWLVNNNLQLEQQN